MRILICGHRSFASQGLKSALETDGHEVYCFSRGDIAREGNIIKGPVLEVDTNPYLAKEQFSVVINYIYMADASIEQNEVYLQTLLSYCKEKQIKHLIHISSVSVYEDNASLISEEAEVEKLPQRKGSYGSLKVAQEQYLINHIPDGVRVSIVRPGFILGAGLVDPIIGTGLRLPWNKLLLIGNSRSTLPVISRSVLNKALCNLVNSRRLSNSPEYFLLADTFSPPKKDYLNSCCRLLGVGSGVQVFPKFIWIMAALAGEILLRLIGKSHVQVLRKIRALCVVQRFNSKQSEQRLKTSFSSDWREQLKNSVSDQKKNFKLPYYPQKLKNLLKHNKHSFRKITFIGFGRIVHQKHLPALKRVEFSGQINAFDIAPAPLDSEPSVKFISEKEIDSSNLFVVTTPGPAHHQAIKMLNGKDGNLLIEKPLCYSNDEFRDWQKFVNRNGIDVAICHNYRFKSNVQQMILHIEKFNPGRLLNVNVVFQSPPVSRDGATWLRKERESSTLLMDYSIHFLDIACMFSNSSWKMEDLRYTLNYTGQTQSIEGKVSSDTYTVDFLLRQGFIPRKASINFSFQNYSISLHFFPDTFIPYMASDNAFLYLKEASQYSRKATRKVIDKLFQKDSDLSHPFVYLAALGLAPEYARNISLESLESFYELMFEMQRAIYPGLRK